MTKLIHLSPLGPLEIPGVLGRPEPGEPFDIDDDLAESLLEQSELYQLAPDKPLAKQKVDDLRAIADAKGIDTTGLKKPQLVAALEQTNAPEAPEASDDDDTDSDPDAEGADTDDEEAQQ